MSDTPLQGTTLGFIGLGLMGKPMARLLLRAGASVVVHNRSQPAMDELAAEGAEAVDSPAEVGRRVGDGLILLMLTDSPATDQVFHGLLHHLAHGALIIDMGTNGVRETHLWARTTREAGADWIDAPVSGGQVAAVDGNLSIMAGGDEAAFARALPVFQVLGEAATHIGPTGTGQVAKIANQMIVAQTIAAVAEAFTLARVSGANLEAVRKALLGGFASSRILELHGRRMIEEQFEPGGRANTQLKDVREAVRLAEEHGVSLPQLDTNLALWITMVEHQLGGLDHSGLYRLYQQPHGFPDLP